MLLDIEMSGGYFQNKKELEDWVSQKGPNKISNLALFLLSRQKFQWSRAIEECVLHVFMSKVKVFEKKVRGQGHGVTNERSCQKEYTCEIWNPSTYNQKSWPRLKFSKEGQVPSSEIRMSRSWYEMKGLARRNAHVKYESSSTCQSNVLTKAKVCWRTHWWTDRVITIGHPL
jgi:hypothetical protein